MQHLFSQRLLVVTHVVHYRHRGRVYAYGPYAREMAIWTALFPHITIAAPQRDEQPPGDALPVGAGELKVVPQVETGGVTLFAKLTQVALLPAMVWRLAAALRGADAVLVRCPGNIGLLGAVLAPLFVRRRIAKYAGQWSGYPGEVWTVRLQRAILRSRWWGAPVLAYSSENSIVRHVVPFFSSAMTADQMAVAATLDDRESRMDGLSVLFVGRLSRDKNVDVLLLAIGLLHRERLPVRCTVVGDGAERAALERLAVTLGIGDVVRFVGALAHDRVLSYYQAANVLVLPSDTEGWPKAIVEGMAFGLVCIGPDRGIVPAILGDGRGMVSATTPTAIASALRQIAVHPERSQEIGRNAAKWARRYTLEHFRDALCAVLREWWTPVDETQEPARVSVRHV